MFQVGSELRAPIKDLPVNVVTSFNREKGELLVSENLPEDTLEGVRSISVSFASCTAGGDLWIVLHCRPADIGCARACRVQGLNCKTAHKKGARASNAHIEYAPRNLLACVAHLRGEQNSKCNLSLHGIEGLLCRLNKGRRR